MVATKCALSKHSQVSSSSSPGGATTPLRPTQVLTPTRLAQRLADAEGDEDGEDGEL